METGNNDGTTNAQARDNIEKFGFYIDPAKMAAP